jgi:hypothetical protein
MKNQIRLSLVIILFFCSLSYAQAQYAIPSIEIELEQENTTFEEPQGLIRLLSAEERQMVVKVEDNDPAVATWAVVVIYSLDGEDELGPYTVTEGTILKETIDDHDWGVKVNSFRPGCVISAWIE